MSTINNTNIKKKVVIKVRINKRILSKLLIVFMIVLIMAPFLSECFGAAATPTLVTRLTSALKKIKDYLVKLGGPAAAVAIATGVMIRKFSFGDEEKMVIGKRVIINAVVCYAIILLIDLIIKFVEALV